VLVSNAGNRHIGAVDYPDVAGRTGGRADRDQSRRRVPVGEALPGRRCARPAGGSVHHDVVAGGACRGAGRSFPAIARPRAGVRLFAKAIAMECATFGDGPSVSTRCIQASSDTPIWGKIPTEKPQAVVKNAPIDSRGSAPKNGDAARPRR